MSFRPRSYPHPVLSPYARDYVDNSEIYGSFERTPQDGNLVVSYDITVTSDRLNEFRADSRVKLGLNLYSKGTRWKELKILDGHKGNFSIPEGLLFGTLELTPVIVVSESGVFELAGHNPEYGTSLFQLEEGDLLAFGPTEALEVDHERTAQDMEAFITLVRAPGDPNVYEVIDGGQQIIVNAGENVMSVVSVMRANPALHPFLFTGIYKDAFSFALKRMLKAYQDEADAESPWATGLQTFIDSAGLNLDEIENLEESLERFVLKMLASDGFAALAKRVQEGKALV